MLLHRSRTAYHTMNKCKPQQPVRFLATPTPESLAELYKKLTGKEMTPQELAYARAKLGTKK